MEALRWRVVSTIGLAAAASKSRPSVQLATSTQRGVKACM